MSQSQHDGPPVIVAGRTATRPVETDEIRALASAAGYGVRGECTQVASEDPGTYFGRGKVNEIADRVAETGAGIVVVDGDLAPGQHHSLESAMPDGTRAVDRYRLVLEIFERRAGTKRAQLQVELARLRYDLPRLIEGADEGLLNRRAEKGSPIYDVRDRIDALERKLDELPDPAAEARRRRREEGFDLVTLAGYTNAGKSTLLHRLADDLTLSDADADHPDETATAAIEDRLFETLETTTRRATIDDRPALVTDTVGYVADLPHRLVESFGETLSEAAAADCVVLVADASDPVGGFREKLTASLEVLAAQDVDREAIVTACNKVDLLAADEREERLAVAADLAPEPIPVSVREGTNLEALLAAVQDRLPTERDTLAMPNCDDAMSLVSEAYDRTAVETVDYDGETVELAVRGRPEVIERLRADAAAIEAGRSNSTWE